MYIIMIILAICQIVADLINYFYEKYHDFNNDLEYQKWLSVRNSFLKEDGVDIE